MALLRTASAGLTAVLALLTIALVHTPAEAKKFAAVDGLASMHDLRVEKGKLCYSDHYHYGGSSAKASKKAAEADAIAAWESFTDMEYGNRWSNFRYAASRSVNCSQGSSGWGCEIEARPCSVR